MNRLSLAALLVALLLGTDDLAKRLRSKDPMERLSAVQDVEREKPEDATKLLAKVLEDDDFEVEEAAARVLGRLGDPKSVKDLTDLALETRITGVRRAAAEALALLDPQDAAKSLAKKAKGKEPANALEALAYLGAATEVAFEVPDLDELAESDDAAVAHWAGRAAAAGSRDGVALAQLISIVRKEGKGYGALAGALDTAALLPTPRHLELAEGLLLASDVDAVVHRRALLVVANAVDLAASKDVLADATDGLEVRTGAEVAWLLLQRIDRSELDSAVLADAKLHCRELGIAAARGADPVTRGAGLRVLERLGEDEDAALVVSMLESSDARTRQRAAKALGRGFDPATWVEPMAARLAVEKERLVREELCVQLGQRGLGAALAPLTAALDDDAWQVATCAAVSIGKLNVDGSAPALRGLTDRREWKLRGAAATGFAWLFRADSVEPLIELLGDKDVSVARTAYEGLKRLARRDDVAADPKAWKEWWEQNRERFRFEHPADREEARKKYGYSDLERPPTPSVYRTLYESFDVLALEGQYDHIQDLLDGMEIPYRLTNPSSLERAEVHPFQAFFANCTGEVTGDDAERLAWMALCGGHVFASCWSLTYTVNAIYPGVIAHDDRFGDQVLGSIPIFPVDPWNRFLPGVFPKDVRPWFHLEGSQLIRVDRPEIAEVLIDSPAARDRFGNGNVVAWFEAGHGMILDSANHFYIHGFEWMPDLDDEEDLQAYAIDHMGLDYARWREIAGEKFWRNKSKAAEEVPETCVFNFITNFVRRYRAGLPR
ncbi:MAG: HEAT repeat domain-containing protein [Planctomycetota bacterium]